MPTAGTSPTSILDASEPVPFEVLNPDSRLPLLFVCDHASRRIPASRGTLGVDPAVRRCHLAWDIGAGELTRRLADATGATAVLQNYSRLVVDCNRELLDPAAFLEFGDGVVINGNRNLGQAEKQARADAIYWPYHCAISEQIARLTSSTCKPAVYSMHSFTPVLNGVSRVWQIGILWDKDDRIAPPLIRALRERDYLVGDNEPYSGKAPQDFTIDHHAEGAGLPCVGIEIRQDLIDNRPGVAAIAELLHPAIQRLQAQLYPTSIGTRRPQLPA
jgi:predicted N-formylglutamate amidohydrolase